MLIPLEATTGKYAQYRGTLRDKDTNTYRQMVTESDTLTFVVVERGTSAAIVTAVTDSGITQDDLGVFVIQLTDVQLARNLFDSTKIYKWDLEFVDGSTTIPWSIGSGPFNVTISPQ